MNLKLLFLVIVIVGLVSIILKIITQKPSKGSK